MLFRPEGLHEPDAAHRLLGHRKELAALLECLAVAALQASQDRAQSHRDQGSGDQRHQRELPRHEEQEGHIGRGRHRLPQDVRERERDYGAGLAGVVQDASDQLPDLHLAEEGQGQVLQVPVHVVPDVSLDVLLHVHGEQAGAVQSEVLDAQGGEHQEAHVAQRIQRIPGADPGSEPAIEELLEAAHVRAAQDLDPEQRLQERDQEHQGERVETRRDDHQDDGPDEKTDERPHVAEQAGVGGPHGRRPQDFGVRSATGRTISSGLTPPCRKLSRYRPWYSRSFVG